MLTVFDFSFLHKDKKKPEQTKQQPALLLPKLHRAFKFEQYDTVKELLPKLSLEELMQKDASGKCAWECHHIPTEILLLIISRWMELQAQQEGISDNGAITLPMPRVVAKDIALWIALDKLKTKDDAEKIINAWLYYSIKHKLNQLSDSLNNFLPMISMMLVVCNKLYQSSTLVLDFCITTMMPFIMLIKTLIMLKEIFSTKRELDVFDICEMVFIIAALVLAVLSFIFTSPAMMVGGAVFGLLHSVFDLYNEFQLYQQSADGTERKIAHKQKCIFLMTQILVNTLSLLMVTLMLSGTFGLLPTFITFAAIALCSIIWALMPQEHKRAIKTLVGFGKPSYATAETAKVESGDEVSEDINDNEILASDEASEDFKDASTLEPEVAQATFIEKAQVTPQSESVKQETNGIDRDQLLSEHKERSRPLLAELHGLFRAKVVEVDEAAQPDSPTGVADDLEDNLAVPPTNSI